MGDLEGVVDIAVEALRLFPLPVRLLLGCLGLLAFLVWARGRAGGGGKTTVEVRATTEGQPGERKDPHTGEATGSLLERIKGR